MPFRIDGISKSNFSSCFDGGIIILVSRWTVRISTVRLFNCGLGTSTFRLFENCGRITNNLQRTRITCTSLERLFDKCLSVSSNTGVLEDINNKIRAIFVFLHDHFVACESNWTMFVQTKSLLTCCGTGARYLWNIQCGCFLPFSVHWRQSRICDTNDLGEQQR